MKDFLVVNKNKSSNLVRRKKESNTKSKNKLILTWVLLFAFAMYFVQQRIVYTRTERNVKKLMLEKRKVNSSILPFKLEQSYLTQFNKVEKIAKRNLALQHPKRSQIKKIIIDNDFNNALDSD